MRLKIARTAILRRQLRVSKNIVLHLDLMESPLAWPQSATTGHFMSELHSETLSKALSEFVGAFELDFHYDWDYTTVMIGGEEPTFLSPGLNRDAESEDCGARGALLEKYRNLKALMHQAGLSPELPFVLDHMRLEPPQKTSMP